MWGIFNKNLRKFAKNYQLWRFMTFSSADNLWCILKYKNVPVRFTYTTWKNIDSFGICVSWENWELKRGLRKRQVHIKSIDFPGTWGRKRVAGGWGWASGRAMSVFMFDSPNFFLRIFFSTGFSIGCCIYCEMFLRFNKNCFKCNYLYSIEWEP